MIKVEDYTVSAKKVSPSLQSPEVLRLEPMPNYEDADQMIKIEDEIKDNPPVPHPIEY